PGCPTTILKSAGKPSVGHDVIAHARLSDQTHGVGPAEITPVRGRGIDVSPINLRDAGEIERAVATFARTPNGARNEPDTICVGFIADFDIYAIKPSLVSMPSCARPLDLSRPADDRTARHRRDSRDLRKRHRESEPHVGLARPVRVRDATRASICKNGENRWTNGRRTMHFHCTTFSRGRNGRSVARTPR